MKPKSIEGLVYGETLGDENMFVKILIGEIDCLKPSLRLNRKREYLNMELVL